MPARQPARKCRMTADMARRRFPPFDAYHIPVAASLAGDHLRAVLPVPEEGHHAAPRRHPGGAQRPHRAGSRPGARMKERGRRGRRRLRAGTGRRPAPRPTRSARRRATTAKAEADAERKSIEAELEPEACRGRGAHRRRSRTRRCRKSARSPRRLPRPSCGACRRQGRPRPTSPPRSSRSGAERHGRNIDRNILGHRRAWSSSSACSST